MELRHLRYFVVLAEELHFARAAERLHIVQPALSMQIKALEQFLGTPLLRRTKRSVELTEPGRLFLEEARRTLEQAGRAAAVARQAGAGTLGRIEIGYSAHAAYSGLLSATIKAFHGRAPEVELALHELHPRVQLEWLLDRRLQVGFLTAVSPNLPEGLEAVRLGTLALKVALPADHPLADKDDIPAAALADEPFIVHASPSGDSSGGAPIRRILGFEPTVRHHAASSVMAVSLVAAGLGVALVPESIASVSVGGNVVYRSVIGAGRMIDIVLAYRRWESDPCTRRLLGVIGDCDGLGPPQSLVSSPS
ncbi:LysR substrate-binding domain-containing protein [Microvirga subterranea]|uniref:LysR family transcriptional regulator n=1 Tax=Microvirga subterranea TaxID=186651 RepID=A0A370HGZ3_9HYPH|nr:LysR substrate-binding domain-containing protein [Microvirga subterranea]RDI57185.1 LysR family transcriptional regulator [Microvirga subterranea]